VKHFKGPVFSRPVFAAGFNRWRWASPL